MSLPIKFLDCKQRIEGKEVRSKLLDPNSFLYLWLKQTRATLSEFLPNISDQRMDFHIELISKAEEPTEELLVSRAQKLEGQNVNILCPQLVDKNFQLSAPENMHITIVHFSTIPQ